ncbi:hypothetical protein ATO6_10165 [Oceanicola sp. 22II-s10i]|uniref:type II secretion system minor pseudopilin GspI n=1 Tax=Oceanicola sp. 22II-s10i TaxID=1317116 RepID=UPI000B521082|nr:type II secretion system minor pseudopilin GspI [Oceanicola sp. 22II-s10i]OWU84705.1 hypothetical protein ATO6_10165 [Oceanicola sp. 22II-s10i]
MTGPDREPEAGFTLIETLVAMAVLAVAGVTLLTATERHAARTTALEDRIAARWVAQNAMAVAELKIQMQPQWQRMLDRDWQVSARRGALADSGLDRVTILVAPPGADPEDTILRLTGYLPASGGQP